MQYASVSVGDNVRQCPGQRNNPCFAILTANAFRKGCVFLCCAVPYTKELTACARG